MSKVGYFLLYWSKLELTLTQVVNEASGDVVKASGRVSGTFSQRLDLWNEMTGNKKQTGLVEQIANQALSVRKIRNTIVHGLLGGNSMSETGTGYIECAVGGYDQPTGEVVRYSIDDLEHIAQSTDACLRAFRDVNDFNYRLDSRFM